MSFTTLDTTDFVISSDSVVAPAWTTGNPTLTGTNMVTGSTASPAPQFYMDVYDTALTGSTAQIQFSIAYGDSLGSGSALYNNLVPGLSPSRTTYGQYRNLVYADETVKFQFGDSNVVNQIFALNIDRNRYKESIFPGNTKIVLGYGGNTINLTDNSVDVLNSGAPITYQDCGRVFQLVSGSYGSATTAQISGSAAPGYSTSGSYGFFLPDIGTIILNAKALALPAASGGIGMPLDTASYANGALSTSTNNVNMYNALVAGNCFQISSQETVSANYVFVRVKNGEYNYSNNPSFLSGSSGQLIYPTLVNNPQTFPTTVGLYNNNGDLLAVAKMSKPMMKDFTHEALIRVKLDW